MKVIIPFLCPSDLCKMSCVSKNHSMMVITAAMELSRVVIQMFCSPSCKVGQVNASLYEKVLQGPCQPKTFHRCVGRGVIYGNLEGAPNGSCFTSRGSHGHGAAISHEIMNGGKYFILMKIDGLVTNAIMAEVGVMCPLFINTWADILKLELYIYSLRRNLIHTPVCSLK